VARSVSRAVARVVCFPPFCRGAWPPWHAGAGLVAHVPPVLPAGDLWCLAKCPQQATTPKRGASRRVVVASRNKCSYKQGYRHTEKEERVEWLIERLNEPWPA
jgi:hypothetical protein